MLLLLLPRQRMTPTMYGTAIFASRWLCNAPPDGDTIALSLPSIVGKTSGLIGIFYFIDAAPFCRNDTGDTKTYEKRRERLETETPVRMRIVLQTRVDNVIVGNMLDCGVPGFTPWVPGFTPWVSLHGLGYCASISGLFMRGATNVTVVFVLCIEILFERFQTVTSHPTVDIIRMYPWLSLSPLV